MIVPPAILRLRLPRSGRQPVHLWLPLLLLWPLLWLIWAIALVVAAAVDLGLLIAGRAYHRYSMLLLHCYLLICETRDLSVRVKAPTADFEMTFL